MEEKMSIATRKALLKHVQDRYREASWREKNKILDEFCILTSYGRKYAISLFNLTKADLQTDKAVKQHKNKKYDQAIQQVLLTIWNASNQICSKRLVPFIPDLLEALERCGHLSLPEDVRSKLLTISSATVDRLLKTDRKEGKKGLCTTHSGSLLKHQIKIRTFADWNDVIPGFLEGDLVAHCGDKTNGAYLNTLVITDIASSWTEFFPILVKGEVGVIAALKVAQQLLPFVLLGLDTDNGSEFINYGLLEFCKENKITFTRSRAYKKNDQAHVEEKNGSIVRRLIGYDRYEGIEAYNALSDLYAVLRLYVNFFQPSLKLLSKKRDGAKVTKKYDKAKTPYQRLMLSSHLTEIEKAHLKKQYDNLDPVDLLDRLVKLQDHFWKHSWKMTTPHHLEESSTTNANIIDNLKTEAIKNTIGDDFKDQEPDVVLMGYAKDQSTLSGSLPQNVEGAVVNCEDMPGQEVTPWHVNKTSQVTAQVPRRYRCTKKPRKSLGPRTWRTCEDKFINEWEKLKIQLELNPALTAKGLLKDLIEKDADKFKLNQLRTLQRRVSQWRLKRFKTHQEAQSQRSDVQDESAKTYISLTAQAVLGSFVNVTEATY